MRSWKFPRIALHRYASCTMPGPCQNPSVSHRHALTEFYSNNCPHCLAAYAHAHLTSPIYPTIFGLSSPCSVRTCVCIQTLAKKANLTSAPRKNQVISHDLQVYFSLNQAFSFDLGAFLACLGTSSTVVFSRVLVHSCLATGSKFLERRDASYITHSGPK